MIKRTIQIRADRGLHVRPCCAFAELANRFDAGVTVMHHGLPFGGKTSMQLISAFIREGDEIEIICDGPDEEEAMAALTALIESGFEEVLRNE